MQANQVDLPNSDYHPYLQRFMDSLAEATCLDCWYILTTLLRLRSSECAGAAAEVFAFLPFTHNVRNWTLARATRAYVLFLEETQLVDSPGSLPSGYNGAGLLDSNLDAATDSAASMFQSWWHGNDSG